VELVTCSAIINYFRKLEGETAKLYETLAEKFPEHRNTFLSLAKESKSNIVAVERAYYSVISDKLEACFIKTLNTDDYSIEAHMPVDVEYPEALKRIITMEENIQKFILDVIKSIGVLVPDVSWTLNRIGKKRADRINKLKILLEKATQRG